MNRQPRVAIVTPYGQEPLELLRRTHVSVRTQTHPCVHVLIPEHACRPEPDTWRARHLGVDDSAPPLARAAALARSEGFDAVAVLTPRCWLQREHVEELLRLHLRTGAGVVGAGHLQRNRAGALLERHAPGQAGYPPPLESLLLTAQAFPLLELLTDLPAELRCIATDILTEAARELGLGYATRPAATLNLTEEPSAVATGRTAAPCQPGDDRDPTLRDTRYRWARAPTAARLQVMLGSRGRQPVEWRANRLEVSLIGAVDTLAYVELEHALRRRLPTNILLRQQSAAQWLGAAFRGSPRGRSLAALATPGFEPAPTRQAAVVLADQVPAWLVDHDDWLAYPGFAVCVHSTNGAGARHWHTLDRAAWRVVVPSHAVAEEAAGALTCGAGHFRVATEVALASALDGLLRAITLPADGGSREDDTA